VTRWDGFTDAARQVVDLAEEESHGLHHNYVGTEHILLGLLRARDGIGARALMSCGLTLEDVRARIDPWDARPQAPGRRRLRVSTEAERALQRAARRAQPGQVDTQDILVGMVAVNDSRGPRLLLELGVYPEGLRHVVAHIVTTGSPPDDADAIARSAPRLAQDDHVSHGFQLALSRARHVAAMRDATHVCLDDLFVACLHEHEGSSAGTGPRDRVFEGTAPILGTLIDEVETRLGRAFDAGDLLVLLAAVPGGIVAEALSALRVSSDALAHAVDVTRRGDARSVLFRPADLDARIDEAEAAMDHANQQGAAASVGLRRRLGWEALTATNDRLAMVLEDVLTRLGLPLAALETYAAANQHLKNYMDELLRVIEAPPR
jgi:hypothetical protein